MSRFVGSAIKRGCPKLRELANMLLGQQSDHPSKTNRGWAVTLKSERVPSAQPALKEPRGVVLGDWVLLRRFPVCDSGLKGPSAVRPVDSGALGARQCVLPKCQAVAARDELRGVPLARLVTELSNVTLNTTLAWAGIAAAKAARMHSLLLLNSPMCVETLRDATHHTVGKHLSSIVKDH
jgi:hypothetical protein